MWLLLREDSKSSKEGHGLNPHPVESDMATLIKNCLHNTHTIVRITGLEYARGDKSLTFCKFEDSDLYCNFPLLNLQHMFNLEVSTSSSEVPLPGLF